MSTKIKLGASFLDELKDLPPTKSILKTALYIPKALETYLQAWNIRDKSTNCLSIERDEVRFLLRLSVARFRHDLMLLARLGLLYLVSEYDENITIRFPFENDTNEQKS